jgi:hypothetical protein
MTDEMIYPTEAERKRVILLGAMTSAYYETVSEKDRSAVLHRFHELVEEWKNLGARVLATLDDDLFMVGEPRSPRFTFYLMFEVDDFDIVTAMIQRIRESANGIRMDRYVRFEAHLGRPFFLLEGT